MDIPTLQKAMELGRKINAIEGRVQLTKDLKNTTAGLDYASLNITFAPLKNNKPVLFSLTSEQTADLFHLAIEYERQNQIILKKEFLLLQPPTDTQPDDLRFEDIERDDPNA